MIASPPSLWETFWMNVVSALRTRWRKLRRACLCCGDPHRLPGRPVCNKCSVFHLQAFGPGAS